jgi:hypothetical protein
VAAARARPPATVARVTAGAAGSFSRPTRAPVTLMAQFARICLLALCLVLVPAVSASWQPVSRTAVRSPHRPVGPVDLKFVQPRFVHPKVGRKAKRKALSLGQRAVRIAASELGVSYRYGGSSPSGFDCSGLVAYVYGKLGVRLPHNAAAQYSYGRAVDRSHLRPGDLVFFHGLGHVGLYIGRGRIIHAPQSGQRVEIQSLASRSGSIEGVRRLVRA